MAVSSRIFDVDDIFDGGHNLTIVTQEPVVGAAASEGGAGDAR